MQIETSGDPWEDFSNGQEMAFFEAVYFIIVTSSTGTNSGELYISEFLNEHEVSRTASRDKVLENLYLKATLKKSSPIEQKSTSRFTMIIYFSW